MVRTRVLKNFDFVNYSDRGRIRERNEDFAAYFDTINGHIFVVCDGMGGHNAGDVASELAVESVRDYLNETYCANPFDAVENAINYANKMIYNMARGNDYLEGMGTTIVLALIRDDKIYYGHVGDSRIYLYRNSILDQLTEDHSFVQMLMKSGLITVSEAKEHPKKHEITKALGLSMQTEPDISPRAIFPQNDDFLLLCTDGLTNLVETAEIEKILDNPFGINDKASKLVSKANRNGGLDNITLILARFHNLDEAEDHPVEHDDRSIMSRVRNLLKNKNFAFLLIFLFVVSTFLFVFTEKEGEKPVKAKQKNASKKQERESDLIIPYRPKPGEDLRILAEKFNTDQETILRLNPHFAGIESGAHIKIPVKSLYVFKQTDELVKIAAGFNVHLTDILKANDLAGMQPEIGIELIIPLKKNNKE